MCYSQGQALRGKQPIFTIPIALIILVVFLPIMGCSDQEPGDKPTVKNNSAVYESQRAMSKLEYIQYRTYMIDQRNVVLPSCQKTAFVPPSPQKDLKAILKTKCGPRAAEAADLRNFLEFVKTKQYPNANQMLDRGKISQLKPGQKVVFLSYDKCNQVLEVRPQNGTGCFYVPGWAVNCP